MPRCSFLEFTQVFSALIVQRKLSKWAPTKTWLRIYGRLSIDTQLHVWPHRQSAYTPLSPLHLLSTVYVTHVINDSRLSTAFPYCDGKLGGAWEQGYRLVMIDRNSAEIDHQVKINLEVQF